MDIRPRHLRILDVVLPAVVGLSRSVTQLHSRGRWTPRPALSGPRRPGLAPSALVLLICTVLAGLAPCRSSAEEAQGCPYAKTECPSDLDISGFVDVYFSHNIANPSDRANLYRVFDATEGSFQLNLAEIVLQKKAHNLGFRMDLDFGPTTDLIHTSFDNTASPPVATVDETYKHIQQAYVTFRLTAHRSRLPRHRSFRFLGL